MNSLPVRGTYQPGGSPVYDHAGNMYFSASIVLTHYPDHPSQVVMRRSSVGSLSVVAGDGHGQGNPSPGKATKARFGTINGIALDKAGNLFIADGANNVIAKVTKAGMLSIFAGKVGKRGRPRVGPAKLSLLDFPNELAFDGAGDLFINDHDNDVIERVTPGGLLSIVAGTAGSPGSAVEGRATGSLLLNVSGLAFDGSENMYVAEAMPDNQVLKVTHSGDLTIIAGRGGYGIPRIGQARQAFLGVAGGVAADRQGNVYVGISHLFYVGEFALVGKVTPDGHLTFVAGRADANGKPTAGKAVGSKLGTLLDLSIGGQGALTISTSSLTPDSYIVQVSRGGRLSFLVQPVTKR